MNPIVLRPSWPAGREQPAFHGSISARAAGMSGRLWHWDPSAWLAAIAFGPLCWCWPSGIPRGFSWRPPAAKNTRYLRSGDCRFTDPPPWSAILESPRVACSHRWLRDWFHCAPWAAGIMAMFHGPPCVRWGNRIARSFAVAVYPGRKLRRLSRPNGGSPRRPFPRPAPYAGALDLQPRCRSLRWASRWAFATFRPSLHARIARRSAVSTLPDGRDRRLHPSRAIAVESSTTSPSTRPVFGSGSNPVPGRSNRSRPTSRLSRSRTALPSRVAEDRPGRQLGRPRDPSRPVRLVDERGPWVPVRRLRRQRPRVLQFPRLLDVGLRNRRPTLLAGQLGRHFSQLLQVVFRQLEILVFVPTNSTFLKL